MKLHPHPSIYTRCLNPAIQNTKSKRPTIRFRMQPDLSTSRSTSAVESGGQLRMPVEMAASAMDLAVSGPVAVGACIGLAIFYVAILYSPTFLLRLPPPDSFHVFMIRRFVCASVSTVLSLIASSALLGVSSIPSLTHSFFRSKLKSFAVIMQVPTVTFWRRKIEFKWSSFQEK